MIRTVSALMTALSATAAFAVGPPVTPAAAATDPCGGRPSGPVIVVSIADQRLAACKDGGVVVDTPITTGRSQLPTPRGSYSVMRKNSPWVMRSPWPRSSPYWYPPSRVQYTLWFRPGYAIHDAPWRARYGPGTETAGTHGCINVPRPAMDRLYAWAAVGTPVIVS